MHVSVDADISESVLILDQFRQAGSTRSAKITRITSLCERILQRLHHFLHRVQEHKFNSRWWVMDWLYVVDVLFSFSHRKMFLCIPSVIMQYVRQCTLTGKGQLDEDTPSAVQQSRHDLVS